MLASGPMITPANKQSQTEPRFELAAEAITLRIRWFGLCVGYVLVNFIEAQSGDTEWQTNQPVLNAILALGTIYAVIDTIWSVRGKVFLSRWPLVISLMEAIFIGWLCHFDYGLQSPFRFYYFLSILVCAIRYSPWITYTTFLLHAFSFGALAFSSKNQPEAEVGALLLMLVLMGWVTWASTALAGLVGATRRRLLQLNDELQQNQTLLEQRIAERTQELQESQAMIVQQEKQSAFGLLAAGIAHEVGNPLAAISSLVQLLNRREIDEYTRERLKMVDDQLRRIQRTLHELVDFGRPATTEESRCDLHALIDAALNIAKYYKRKKGKSIVTNYADDLPKLRIVRDQMVQVFLNLILNAMDATDEGSTIEITTSLEGERISVAIRDNGSGISATHQDRLFQPYFTTKETGTGLGLFVCKNIVEQQNGGNIELTESSSSGTTFSVFLRCETSASTSETNAAMTAPSEEVSAS